MEGMVFRAICNWVLAIFYIAGALLRYAYIGIVKLCYMWRENHPASFSLPFAARLAHMHKPY